MSSNSNMENNHENAADDLVGEKYDGLLYEIKDLEEIMITQFHNCEAEDKVI
ncbi:5478_t:CDS:1, partial [Ambispora gerdemannii]